MFDESSDLMDIAHDFLTDEEIAEILAEEDALGVDISLDEILDDEEDDEYSDWAE